MGCCCTGRRTATVFFDLAPDLDCVLDAVAAGCRTGAPSAAAFGGRLLTVLLAVLFAVLFEWAVGAAVFFAADGAGEEDWPSAKLASQTVANHANAAILVGRRKV